MTKKIILSIFLFIYSYQSFSQNWDINTLRDINLHRNKSLDNTFKFISNSVTPLVFGVPGILFASGYLQKDSLTKHRAIYIAESVIISTVISSVSKRIIKRERPFITYPDIENVVDVKSYSMPSGHTSDAFALATSVSVAYPKWYIVVPSFAWAGSVGYSRLHLGLHYPSDVIAGALLGTGAAYLSYKLNKWLFSPRQKHLL